MYSSPAALRLVWLGMLSLTVCSGCGMSRSWLGSRPPRQSEPDVEFATVSKSKSPMQTADASSAADSEVQHAFEEQYEPGSESDSGMLSQPGKILKKVIPLPRTDKGSAKTASPDPIEDDEEDFDDPGLIKFTEN